MTSFEERIRRERGNMSKSFAKLADFLLDAYIEASFMTASELAHVLNLDAATVVRFSQHLGYRGYPQLQGEIRIKVKQEILLRPHELEGLHSVTGAAATALRDMIKDLEGTRQALDAQGLENLVEAIGQARRVRLAADPAGTQAARELANCLEEGGFCVSLAEPTIEGIARLLQPAKHEDLVVVIDVQGFSGELRRALEEAQSREIPTAVLAGMASLASARFAKIVLAAQSRASFTAKIVLVDALTAALIHALRWRYPERFKKVDAGIAALRQRLQSDDPS